MQKLRVVFIGCVQLSQEMLKEVLASEHAEVVGVISRTSSEFHSDFSSLLPLAKEKNIPSLVAQGNSQDDFAPWIQQQKADVVYCFGWPYLLNKTVLNCTRLGAIGYHPAALPKNRGRHPLIWAIALGLRETASTFFFMDEGADSGDILSQEPVSIDDKDVGEVYSDLMKQTRTQVRQFTKALQAGDFRREPQNAKLANTWRKRGKLDGQIDWRMSAQTIHNLVRALTRPYVGAHALYQNQEFKIWKTQVIPDAPENIEPGQVLQGSPKQFIVKCGEGALQILEHSFSQIPEQGKYL